MRPDGAGTARGRAEKPAGQPGGQGEQRRGNRSAQVVHPIPPVFDGASQILILGSFPSVKSREARFFYGHPQNRFWRVLAGVFGCDLPETVPQKRAFLLNNHTAVWDVIAQCEITGSSDASIRNVRANDLTEILRTAQIRAVFVNGKTAERLYRKYIEPVCGRPCMVLPSTSPANAAWSAERLTAVWAERILPFMSIGQEEGAPAGEDA